MFLKLKTQKVDEAKIRNNPHHCPPLCCPQSQLTTRNPLTIFRHSTETPIHLESHLEQETGVFGHLSLTALLLGEDLSSPEPMPGKPQDLFPEVDKVSP